MAEVQQNNANFDLNVDLSNSRFGNSSDIEIAELVESRHSANTKRSTKRCINLFREYLIAKGEPADFENFDKPKLQSTLARFYANARKKDGHEYRKSSLQNLKNGLKRYILEKCDIDISGAGFSDTNKVYSAKVVDLKRQGNGDVKHKEPIESEDLIKLYKYFEQYESDGKINPKILQQKVFFDLLLHFCR